MQQITSPTFDNTAFGFRLFDGGTPTIYTVTAEIADWDHGPNGGSKLYVQREVVGHYATLAYAKRVQASPDLEGWDSVDISCNDGLAPELGFVDIPF